MLRPGNKIICILNKRTAFSELPKLYVGKEYTFKSNINIGFVNPARIELNEHPGFYYPPELFKTIIELRKQKIEKISKSIT